MTNPNYSTTTTTILKKSWQNCDHITPRRCRRSARHFNKMSLMLLIFFGCCSTLILWPLDVQAKDLNTAVSAKGENMLGNDHDDHHHHLDLHSHQAVQGNALLLEGEGSNVNVDKTNDNGTFKRLQTSEKSQDEDDEEDHSSEVIEMIQPPHTLRHQEHYKQRILQDFKHEREYELEQKNDDEADKEEQEKEEEEEVLMPQHNRHLKYQQNHIALQEPITPPIIPQPQHHHRRHETHFATQKEFKWPKHHLRHQQQHQHHHQNPESQHSPVQLRHQRHDVWKQNYTTTTTVKPLSHRRYFDRASSYQNPLGGRIGTTEGPHMRHMKSITFNPHNRLYNDDNNNNNNNNNHEEEIKRFSLLLDENDKQNSFKPQQDGTSLDEKDVIDDPEADYDLEDDYSYEDEEDDQNKPPLKYPSASSSNKNTVKRYTNPLRSLYKPSTSSSHTKQVGVGGGNLHIRHSLHHNTNTNDYDYEEDKSSSSPSESVQIDEKFSDDKWMKKEHEHYRKQMQHQRAMQALRSQRPALDNSASINRLSTFSSLSSSSSSSASAQNTASTKRQVINDDDTENIYSRNYVHGSVTRKKEEELGSPTAVLESRRQYALQQRQNKALASAHHRRIMTEGSCRLPQPRVERVRKDSWKIYTPHCTILHRCADDTGCCPSERQTCAPKRTKNVDLNFFVISLNETQGSIEKLTFVNHTECHCVDKTKQRAAEYGDSRAHDLITNQISFLRRATTVLNCNCPNLFEKILQEDGYCRCDCSSGNMGCDWLKRGMEHFSMYDRKCIIEERCKLPTCEYGQYIKKHGRCPRREDRHLSVDKDW